MANHPSAIKRHRQSLRRRDRNREARLKVRNAIKAAKLAISKKDPKAAELVKTAEKIIAKAQNKGLYHRNNAARKVSRLNTGLNAAKK